jgi:hypothetical protein
MASVIGGVIGGRANPGYGYGPLLIGSLYIFSGQMDLPHLMDNATH